MNRSRRRQCWTLTPVLVLAGAGCAGDDHAAPEAPSESARAPAPGPGASAPAPAADAPEAGDLEEAMADFGRVLKAVVTDDGLVRYDRLADGARRRSLDAVVRRIGSAPLPPERDERLALWCNAYNANVLVMALEASRKPGFESVVKVPGFFDTIRITVAGESLTLNQLENERIRPLGDPRIHAALVCAAVSCPPLRNEPFDAARLDGQLDDQCVRWVNDPRKFRVANDRLGLSEILKWYGEDFEKPPYSGAIGFVTAFAKPGSDLTRYVVNADAPKTEWITYDWALNRAPATGDPDGS